jgi:hypothetical protein
MTLPQLRQRRASAAGGASSCRGLKTRLLAVHARAEALRRLGPKARRVVLEVMIERGGALDAVPDAPPLALARRRFRDLDAGP